MKECLMGVETEYAVSALNSQGKSVDREKLLGLILASARSQFLQLPDVGNGMFFQNGARMYMDTGLHPEFSTPECPSPLDAVHYIHAGEIILGKIARHVEQSHSDIREVQLFRTNVDYGGTQSTWGCHESYLHAADPLNIPEPMIPHLVSRIIYSGAGGFNPISMGVEFTLSPRVTHLIHEVSGESTNERGIFHTKNEALAKEGFNRLHIICGESLCSHTASWLKLGTTALVLVLIEAGVCRAEAVQLDLPLLAMQAFSKDPQCRTAVPLCRGGAKTAVEIQRHYLTQVEANLGRKFMPRWAEEVCECWRRILDQLESSPESTGKTLDWAIKLPFYQDRARRRGVRWESMPHWTYIANNLNYALTVTELPQKRSVIEYLLSRQSPIKSAVDALTPYLKNNGLNWEDFPGFVSLRSELFEIDMRFGQLGDKGIFSALDRTGLLRHRINGSGNDSQITENPPEIGRASLRGRFVERNAADKGRYCCDWEGIWDQQGKRIMDLSDPFETEERWRNLTEAEAEFGPEFGVWALRARLRQPRVRSSPVENAARAAAIRAGIRQPGS